MPVAYGLTDAPLPATDCFRLSQAWVWLGQQGKAREALRRGASILEAQEAPSREAARLYREAEASLAELR